MIFVGDGLIGTVLEVDGLYTDKRCIAYKLRTLSNYHFWKKMHLRNVKPLSVVVFVLLYVRYVRFF